METLNILFLFFITDDTVCWSMTHIQMCRYFIHCNVAIFLHDSFNHCNALWCHYWVCPDRVEDSLLQNWCRSWTSQSTRTLAVVTDTHHRTELSFVDEFRWVLPLRYLKRRITERCSSLVHVASEAASFTLLLRRHVAFLHRTATCRPLFKPSVSLLSTYKTIELCFELLSHFYGFHLTLPRISWNISNL